MSPPRNLWPLTVILLLLLAACGGDPADTDGAGGDGTGDDEAGADEAAEGALFAFGFGYDTGDEIAQVRVDSYREQFPDVELTFSESGFDEQTFLSALASGEPPDVVNLPRNQLGTYVARGVLQPLDDCLAQEGVDIEGYYEAAVAQVTVDGSVYGLPEFYNSRVWILNNAAFEAAGVDPETVDLSDWDAIAEANEQLTQMDGGQLQRIGLDPKLPEFLPLWAHANGSSLLSEDGTQANLADPAVVEALEFASGLHEAAGGRTTFMDYRDTWDFFGAGNQYASDQLAGMPMEQWYLNVLAESSPDAEITVRPFETRDGEPITWTDGNAWAIAAATESPAVACSFIATMTAEETWLAAAESRAATRAEEGLPNTGTYTGNRNADEVIFGEVVDLSDIPQFQEAVDVVISTQDAAFTLPPSAAATQFETIWTAAVNEVLGGADAAETMEAAQQEAQAALDDAAQ